MDTQAQENTETTQKTTETPHEIRITTHGKIQAWVTFALDHFTKNPEQPFTLHTLPSSEKKDTSQIPSGAGSNPDGTAAAQPKKERMHPSTSTVPRLISVVEIIKREYLKTLDPSLAEQGKLSGLHQYNMLGEVPTPASEGAQSQEERAQALALALQGKRHLRQHKVPYMKITLSKAELPELASQGFTYQPPDLRRLSRSALARLKKRQKKAGEQQAEAEEMSS